MSDCFTPTVPRITLNCDTGLVSNTDPLADLFEYIYQRPLRLIIPPDGFELTGEICMEDTEFPYILANDLKVYSLPSYVGLRLVCRKKRMFAGYKFVLLCESQTVRKDEWYETPTGGMVQSQETYRALYPVKVFRRETLYEPQED